MASKTSALRVNVTPEMDEELKRIAAAEEVSVATVVRWALKSYIQYVAEEALASSPTR